MHSLLAEIINVYKKETAHQRTPFHNIQVLCYGPHVHRIQGEVKHVKTLGNEKVISVLSNGGKTKRLNTVRDGHGIKALKNSVIDIFVTPVITDSGKIEFRTLKEQNPDKVVDMNEQPQQISITDWDCRENWKMEMTEIPLSKVESFRSERGITGINYTAA